MKLFGIQTFGVRGVADGSYSFANAAGDAADLVVVTGASGAGKTRLLELLVAAREALAPTDEGIDEDVLIRRGNRTAKAIIAFWLSPDERAIAGTTAAVIEAELVFGADEPHREDPALVFLLERYAHDDATPKFEYFSERRRLDVGGGEMDLGEDRQRRFRTSKSPRKFAFVPGLLAALRLEPARAARFASTLAALSRACRYDLTHHRLVSGTRVLGALDELTGSEADAVLFAATAALIGLSRSIVLVDNPTVAGIDPQRALRGLASLGVDNQLIVTTSSAALATAASGTAVRLVVDSTRF